MANLVSLQDKRASEKLIAKARALGIPVEEEQVSIAGRPGWRLRVSGFDTSAQARRYGEVAGEKLGLKGVWVNKE